MDSRPVLKPQFTTDFLEAVIREGPDELTLRREEGVLRAIMDITDAGDNGCFDSWVRIGMPLVEPFSKVSRNHNVGDRVL